MAVKINLTDGTGSKTADFKQEKTPATQGNVINTLNAYNEKIKKEYYDKNQARADENALQESIQKIVELLAKDTSFKSKTKPANTESEDTEEDRIERYLGSFDEDKEKTFDEAGLVRKINVIANILSGNVDGEKDWTADVHGNNVGKNESTLNVSVVGITRKTEENTYKATFISDGDNRELKIDGLNNTEITRPNGEPYENDVSEITVLSEKQVAQMVSQSLKVVLGGFDSQIANIIAYLLFQEEEIPEAYKFVLQNTNDEGIKSAPLYVTYEDKEIGEFKKIPFYYIHDLNGDRGNIETPDYCINSDNIGNALENGIVKGNFKIQADPKFTKLEILYDNNDNASYFIKVPQKTLTLNLHDNFGKATGISYKCTLFGREIDSGKFEFNPDGTSSVNFPQGSIVEITKPTGFDDQLFWSENYTGTETLSIDLSEDDAHVYNKKITFNFEDSGSESKIEYYNNKLTLNVSLKKAGYKPVSESLFAGTIANNNLTVSTDKIWSKVSENTDEFVLNSKINWTNKSVKVRFTYNDTTNTEQSVTVHMNTGAEITQTVDSLSGSDKVVGKTFEGWKLGDNICTSVPFTDDESIDLIAVQAGISYKNYYCLNGGSWDTGITADKEHTFLTASKRIPTSLSRPGYTFVGWYKQQNLEADDKVENYVNWNCTYYAKWEENTYIINFLLNDHDQLLEGANPMFKYSSMSVKASNLPITLGRAYATGYDFVGWAKTNTLNVASKEANNLDSYANVSKLDISDFENTNTVSLSAVWEAKEVSVILEYYYEVEGQIGKYDLLETSVGSARVGEGYSGESYSANKGFREKDVSPITVKPVGNVLKKYFDRNTFTVTYKGISDSAKTVTYKYSDNAQELLTVDNELFDCWLRVEGTGDNVTKTPIKNISAYHFGDFIVEARFNQDAPVLGRDFTVKTEVNKITVSAIGSNGTLYLNDGTIKEIKSDSPVVFDYSNVYPDDVATTKSCFVYFAGNESTNLNPSSLVEIELIYNSTKPVENVDYSLDSTTSSIIKKVDGLEYRIGDSTNYYDLSSSLVIGRNDTIRIRRKETFSRFASEDAVESFNGKLPASVETLKKENFNVVDVSYKEQGHIEILAAVFDGNHGALQYQTGSGNAWLNVNRTESGTESTTLYVDKPCTVSFRYNESDEYLASSETVDLVVGIKKHTVTFDKSNIPSSSYTFGNLPEDQDGFKLVVDSGSQLCKVEDYISTVDKWTVTGYSKNVGALGRTATFLKKGDVYYNEASIIDDDIKLSMEWKANEFNNVIYTDKVYLGDTVVDLPTPIRGSFKYGKPVSINLVHDLATLASDDETLVKVLNVIDQDTNKLLVLSTVLYKEGDSNYDYTGVELEATSTTHEFDYFGTSPNFSRYPDSFPYMFASKFDFVESTNTDNAVIQFKNDTDAGINIGKVQSVGYYGGHGLENFKFNVSGTTLNVYYKDDPRAVNYNTLDTFKVESGNMNSEGKITVVFHSACINKVFWPKQITDVIAIKPLITNPNAIYTLSINTTGATVIEGKDGWTITQVNTATNE